MRSFKHVFALILLVASGGICSVSITEECETPKRRCGMGPRARCILLDQVCGEEVPLQFPAPPEEVP